VERLGFSVAFDTRVASGERWVAVSPPDGTAVLALVVPKPDSEECKLIGGFTQIVFLTDDVATVYDNLSGHGVRFHHPPQKPKWGGMFTTFEDPDGNILAIVDFDAATRELEDQRRSIAERMESERRAAQELEIAKQVQARLFPQTLPRLKTLDYAGTCIQARQVGGDYYDFLNLGRQRLGLVIGDVSGKGIAAALMMANLQANLRSQCAIALDRPQLMLQSVNQLFYENTTESTYATLFFAEYDDEARRLRYANCGHLSALLIRNDQTVEQLESTSTVLGLFKEWNCSMRERLLSPGDVLAFYTDGITEALNTEDEEFGEHRLIEALQRNRELPPQALLTSIIDGVQQFSSFRQHDDITLIVARCGGD
jgi:serine phosphatase RsbU (regulator of sigma subunit)/predicted enzyme related to lactoylglutathione lyase